MESNHLLPAKSANNTIIMNSGGNDPTTTESFGMKRNYSGSGNIFATIHKGGQRDGVMVPVPPVGVRHA